MSSIDLLFIHGGPGLNSNPEREILSQLLDDRKLSYYFWDEPSELRASKVIFDEKKAFTNCLHSLHQAISEHKPKTIAASSFGGLLVLNYLSQFPIEDTNILFIGPTFDLDSAFKKMMTISENDFAKNEPGKASKLSELRKGIKELWDDSTQKGLALAWENPLLLSHYFENSEIMMKWAQSLSDPQFAQDPKSQNAILMELKCLPEIKEFDFKGHVKLFNGHKDPVVDPIATRQVLTRYFSSFEEEVVSDAGHFPHLENPEAFIQAILAMKAD